MENNKWNIIVVFSCILIMTVFIIATSIFSYNLRNSSYNSTKSEINNIKIELEKLRQRVHLLETNQQYALDYARGLLYKKVFDNAVRRKNKSSKK